MHAQLSPRKLRKMIVAAMDKPRRDVVQNRSRPACSDAAKNRCVSCAFVVE